MTTNKTIDPVKQVAPLPIDFGRQLIQRRKAKMLTQAQLAAAAKINQGYYSRLEGGKVDGAPTREVVQRLAEALGCTEIERADLLHLAGYAPRHLNIPDTLLSIANEALALPEEDLAAILQEVRLRLQARESAGLSEPAVVAYREKVQSLLARQAKVLGDIQSELSDLEMGSESHRLSLLEELEARVEAEVEALFGEDLAALNEKIERLRRDQEAERAAVLAEGERLAAQFPSVREAQKQIATFSTSVWRPKSPELDEESEEYLCAE